MSGLLHVLEPGLFTTVQDLGRPSAITAGVSPGGAMDRFAHSTANLLVGNEVGLATLECTLSGPRLEVEHSCLLAVTGADFELQVNGKPIPMWTGIFLSPGDQLSFKRRVTGARAYVGIAGGVAGDRWLGSISTNLMAARGGMRGRILTRGDVLTTATDAAVPVISGRHLDSRLRPDYASHALHAIRGPHANRLDADAVRALFSSTFAVSRDADRMGYRLDGPQLRSSGDELLSFGLTAGAVQLPAGGQPILLMADHQTAGGYPVVAAVISASLPIAAQLAPGEELRFVETGVDEALRLRAMQQAALASLRS